MDPETRDPNPTAPDAEAIDAVDAIAAAAERADGAGPLDEATRLALRHHPERVRAWVRDDAFALVIGRELTLVVHPDARGRGEGARLLEALLTDLPDHAADAVDAVDDVDEVDGPLAAWSHGDHPAAAALARSHGFDRVRELWVMRRPSTVPLPGSSGVGLELRGYRPEDAAELLRVNAAAFADHPEQGGMDAENLVERMAEPWFDPEGLIVAMDGERMLGFHWTKRHPAVDGHGHEHGEVYVVGIDPGAQGRGLGKALTLAGVRHLVEGGAQEVLLYVESDNAPAIAVYSGLGFEHAARDTHVMYRRD